MIIAAHAGTGKTYFAKKVFDSVDFVCMPYKYYLPEANAVGVESELSKASLDLVMRLDWPDNYIRAVVNQYHRNRYVIIPPVVPVIRALEAVEIPVMLFYPEYDAKGTYEERYRSRGNSEEFIDIFIGGWDDFHRTLESLDCKHRFVMKKEEYLTDYLEQIDIIIDEEESLINIELTEMSSGDVRYLYESTGIEVAEHVRRFCLETVRTNGENLKDLKNEIDFPQQSPKT